MHNFFLTGKLKNKLMSWWIDCSEAQMRWRQMYYWHYSTIITTCPSSADSRLLWWKWTTRRSLTLSVISVCIHIFIIGLTINLLTAVFSREDKWRALSLSFPFCLSPSPPKHTHIHNFSSSWRDGRQQKVQQLNDGLLMWIPRLRSEKIRLLICQLINK